MADPVFFNIPTGAWLKVATNVIGGTIHKLKNSKYGQTYRLTGTAPPTLATDRVAMFEKSSQESIQHSAGIDVYIYCTLFAGRVRVDA